MKNYILTLTKEEIDCIRLALAFFAANNEKSDPKTAEEFYALFKKVTQQTV